MKKLISLTLAAMLLLTSTTMVSAAQYPVTNTATPSSTSQVTQQKEGISERIAAKPVDISKIKGKTIQLNTNGKSLKASSKQVGEKVKLNTKGIKQSVLNSINNKMKLGQKAIQNSKLRATSQADSPTYQVFTFNGTIKTEGDIYPISPITLQPGQILQAQMDGPQNTALEYDLYLFQFDATTGKLNTTPVDASTYTGTAAPEAVGTVNKATTAQSYAVIAASRKGSSATDQFTLNISLGTSYDTLETNENAFTASKFQNDLTADKSDTIAATLNSPYDNDWFDIYVPSTADFKSIMVSPTPSSDTQIQKLNFEMYRVSNGTEMAKQTSSGYELPVQQGHNYFRISAVDHSNSFSNVAYNITITPVIYAASAKYQVLVNGSALPIQNYNPGGERYALLEYSTFEWIVTYYSASGYLATGAKDHITAQIYDKDWNEGTPGYYKMGQDDAKNGVAHITMTTPSVIGAYSSSFLYYDYDASLILTSSQFGEEYNQPVFITSRIMG